MRWCAFLVLTLLSVELPTVAAFLAFPIKDGLQHGEGSDGRHVEVSRVMRES